MYVVAALVSHFLAFFGPLEGLEYKMVLKFLDRTHLDIALYDSLLRLGQHKLGCLDDYRPRICALLDLRGEAEDFSKSLDEVEGRRAKLKQDYLTSQCLILES